MLLFCRLFQVQLFIINIYSEKFTVVRIKIEYSIDRRVAHRDFFNSMSYRFVLRLGSGLGTIVTGPA
jgi:hypothetical protein